MKRRLLTLLPSVAWLCPAIAMAAPCIPAKTATDLLTAAQSGCSPITFDATISNTTLTIPAQIILKASVTLDGQTKNVTLAADAALTKPLIKLDSGSTTIKNVTITAPGKTAVYFSGALASSNTIQGCRFLDSKYALYVGGGLHNRLTTNTFSGNGLGGGDAIFYKTAGGVTAAPTITRQQLNAEATAWTLAGTGPANGTVELYLADTAPGVPAQGETFMETATADANGAFEFTLAYPNVDPAKGYTLLAIATAGDTSPFGAVTTPTDDAAFFALADPDGDEIFTVNGDNCPEAANADQSDLDNDDVGDACDNCAFIHTDNFNDGDADGIGDVCDPDLDGDGVSNSPPADNCPLVANGDQADSDTDGVGDACDAANPPPDTDLDNDGVEDGQDNCIGVANPDQIDDDSDGLGDVCDDDVDGDSVPDASDNCPAASNADQRDSDADGRGDACELSTGELDDDADGIANASDNCPKGFNPEQTDSDQDSFGDACDADTDGDGALNWVDNCPAVPNPDQLDDDTDGAGNACDLTTSITEQPVNDQSGCSLLTGATNGAGLNAVLFGVLLSMGFAIRRRGL